MLVIITKLFWKVEKEHKVGLFRREMGKVWEKVGDEKNMIKTYRIKKIKLKKGTGLWIDLSQRESDINTIPTKTRLAGFIRVLSQTFKQNLTVFIQLLQKT